MEFVVVCQDIIWIKILHSVKVLKLKFSIVLLKIFFISLFLFLECSFRCDSCMNSAENCIECSDSKNRSLNKNCSCQDGYYEIQN